MIEMNRRLATMDQSLSAPMRADGEAEWQDMLAADGPDQESMIAEASELEWRRDLLAKGLETLNERERHILNGRRLRDEAMTLADLGHIYGVSRERVRQIEVRAFGKLQKAMLTAAANQPSSPPVRHLRSRGGAPATIWPHRLEHCRSRLRPSAIGQRWDSERERQLLVRH